MLDQVTGIVHIHIKAPAVTDAAPRVYPLTVTYDDLREKDNRVEADVPPLQWESSPEIESLVDELYDGSISPDDVQKIGQYLFERLFSSDDSITEDGTALSVGASPSVIHIWARAQQVHNYVRLALTIDPPELRRYPWEAMNDAGQYLSTQARTPVVRQPSNVESKTSQRFRQLNVLFVTASPTHYDETPLPALDTEKTLDDIQLNLQKNFQPTWKRRLGIEQAIHAESLPNATPEALANKLGERPPLHIVCFIVHGTPDALYLARDYSDEARVLTPEKLAEILDNAPHVQLVMLLACDTARHVTHQQTNEPLATFADKLMQQAELPAVVAMQLQIQSHGAHKFTATFMQFLAEFRPIDVAFAEARRNLLSGRSSATRNTIAPVLYLQARDSRIFKNDLTTPLIVSFLSLVAVVALLLFSRQWVTNQRDSAIAQERLTVEMERQLQILGHINQFEELPIGTAPADLYHTDNHIWYVDDTRNQLVALNKSDLDQQQRYAIGGGAYPPQASADALWVVSRESGQVYRFPLAEPQASQHVNAGLELAEGVVTPHGIWVRSLLDDTLTHITHEMETQSFTLVDSPDQFFYGGQYIWSISEQGMVVQRFNAATQAAYSQTLSTPAQAAFYMDGKLWLITDSQLEARHPDTLERVEQVRLSFVVDDFDYFDDEIWFINESIPNAYRYVLADETLTPFSLDALPRLIRVMSEDVFIATADDQLMLLPRDEATKRRTFPVANLTSLRYLIDDGTTYWVPVRNDDLLLNIHQATYRTKRLIACEAPQRPYFDGTRLWTICAGENTISVGPAHIRYIGLQNYQSTSQTHVPLYAHDLLWVVQEGAGTVVAFDMAAQRPRAREELSPDLLPLQSDDTYLWTADADNGILYRLSPSFSQPNLLDPIRRLQVDVAATSIEGSIQSIAIVNNHVWVLHAQITALGDATTLSIIHQDTLALQQSYPLGLVVAGLTRVADEIWLSVGETEHGSIYRLDAHTGALLDDEPFHEFADSPFTPWRGTVTAEHIYFTLGAPTMNEADFAAFMQSGFSGDAARLEPLLVAYNRQTQQWEDPIDIINAPQNPTYDEQHGHFWYLSSYTPVMGEMEQDNAGVLFGIDVADGTSTGVLDLCSNADTPYITGNFVWINCNQPHTTLYAYDRETMQQVAAFPNVGEELLPPLVTGTEGVFIFEASQTGVIFDVITGEKLQEFDVGRAPTAPFLLDDTLWTYNVGDGFLQRITQFHQP